MAASGGGLDDATVVEVVQAFERNLGRTSRHDASTLAWLRAEGHIGVEPLADLVLDPAGE